MKMVCRRRHRPGPRRSNTSGEFTRPRASARHEYFELDKGFLTAGTLTCALHLSRFDLTNGEPLDPPAELPLEVYPVVVEDGRVLIEVRDGPLPASNSPASYGVGDRRERQDASRGHGPIRPAARRFDDAAAGGRLPRLGSHISRVERGHAAS